MTPAELRALIAKATPGEWTAQHHHEGGAGDRRSMVLAETKLYGHDVIGVFDDERVLSPEAMANAALIVASVNALPALLDVVEAARSVLPHGPCVFHCSADSLTPCGMCRLRAALARLGGK